MRILQRGERGVLIYSRFLREREGQVQCWRGGIHSCWQARVARDRTA